MSADGIYRANCNCQGSIVVVQQIGVWVYAWWSEAYTPLLDLYMAAFETLLVYIPVFYDKAEKKEGEEEEEANS